MSELIEQEIENGRLFYYAAGIVCLAGVITLFFYPLHGIGLILFGGFLLYWSLAGAVVAVNRDMSAKLTEIIAYLDDAREPRRQTLGEVRKLNEVVEQLEFLTHVAARSRTKNRGGNDHGGLAG